MSTRKIVTYAALNSSLTALYVLLIVIFMSNAGHLFPGKEPTPIIPFAMLSLFVFSAALSGALVLGRPVLWYLDGKKSEALWLFTYTLIGLFLFSVIGFVCLYFLV